MNKYQEALNDMYAVLDSRRWHQKKNILQELVDKETPMKPIGDLDSVPHYRCPSCFCTVKLFDDSQCDKYCQHCGQALDWSEE